MLCSVLPCAGHRAAYKPYCPNPRGQVDSNLLLVQDWYKLLKRSPSVNFNDQTRMTCMTGA